MTICLNTQRRQWRRFSLGLAVLCLAACSKQPAPTDANDGHPVAELLLTSGHVYTVDKDRSWAEAVAIADGKILWTGSDVDARKYVGAGTRQVDLNGKMVLPGFQDAHIHPVGAGVAYQQCALFDIRGVDALRETITECARRTPEGWITGKGWLVDNFPAGLPDKKILDELVPDRPVALESSDGHSLWVNSKALEIAGISAATPDPAGGRIDRYAGGAEPSGSLQEESAMGLVFAKVPPVPAGTMLKGLEYARDYLHSVGITGVQDAMVKLAPAGDSYAGLEAYRTLDERGELKLHVVAAMYLENVDAIEDMMDEFKSRRESDTVGNVYATAVKIFMDGVLEMHTAALLDPYVSIEKQGYRGELLQQPDPLDRAVTQLDAEGFQVHFHAIGDRAIRVALDAVEAARKSNGKRDARHHISHLQLFDPEDIPRFAELDVVANFQPLWAMNDNYITELTVPFIGGERSQWLYPIASIKRSGGRIAFGSDWSVSSANPLEGIEVAVTRLDPAGPDPDGPPVEPLGENEAISLGDAIAAYTINSAYVNFLDDRTGSIEPGKLADLVILDKNLFNVHATEIGEVNVTATLFGGEVVYGGL